MLYGNLHSSTRIISSNAAFVTLSAATVIIAASLVPKLAVSLGGMTGPDADVVSKGIHILDEHRWQFEGAVAAKHQLEKFRDTVNKAKRLRSAGESDPPCVVLAVYREPFPETFHLTASSAAPFESSTSQGPGDFPQTSQVQIPCGLGEGEGEGAIGEFDFSDPLWDFQWGGSLSIFDGPGHTV